MSVFLLVQAWSGWSVGLESFDKRITHMYTFVDVYDNVEIFVMLISLIAQRCD